MGILDSRNEFADALSVANAAGTYNIGNVIDTEIIGLDVGESADLWVVLTVDTAIITGGSAGTIQFRLVSDAQNPPTADNTPTKHWEGELFVTGASSPKLPAGAIFAKFKLPAGDYERYIGIQYVIGTTTITAGKINAFLAKDFGRTNKFYADAQN